MRLGGRELGAANWRLVSRNQTGAGEGTKTMEMFPSPGCQQPRQRQKRDARPDERLQRGILGHNPQSWLHSIMNPAATEARENETEPTGSFVLRRVGLSPSHRPKRNGTLCKLGPLRAVKGPSLNINDDKK